MNGDALRSWLSFLWLQRFTNDASQRLAPSAPRFVLVTQSQRRSNPRSVGGDGNGYAAQSLAYVLPTLGVVVGKAFVQVVSGRQNVFALVCPLFFAIRSRAQGLRLRHYGFLGLEVGSDGYFCCQK
jgi:hypothetical protein